MNHAHHDPIPGETLDLDLDLDLELGGAAEASYDEGAAGAAGTTARRGLAATWHAITAGIAVVAGITPHVLHHIGLFAGAFLITGAAGNVLFGAAGLMLSIPLLRRLHRRFATWKAPATAVAVFAVMFSVSAFVIGPAISDTGDDTPPESPPSRGEAPDEHAEHHD